MATLTELVEKKNEVKAKADELLALIETEAREFTEEEKAQYDAYIAELEGIEAEIATKEGELRNVRVKIKPQSFSLLNAIKAEVEHRSFTDFEKTIVAAGKSEMQKANLSYGGNIVLPANYNTRASIQATVTGAGIENVETDKLAILPALRNRLALVDAGAQYLTGLVGNVSIPVYSGSNVAWAAENGEAVDAGGSFTQVNYSPKRLTANLKISKQFLLQDSHDAESLLQNDLVAAIAEKLEATLLGSNAGSSSQPAGLGNLLTPVAVASYSDVVALEGALEASNVYKYKYVLSPSAKAFLRSLPKETGQALFVYGDTNEINGNKALSTNSVATDNGFVGDWSDYIVAQWGGIDVVVDQYTLASSGMIRLVVNSYWDGKPRRLSSFKAFTV
jgi:HK97 family phage major capsid protein